MSPPPPPPRARASPPTQGRSRTASQWRQTSRACPPSISGCPSSDFFCTQSCRPIRHIILAIASASCLAVSPPAPTRRALLLAPIIRRPARPVDGDGVERLRLHDGHCMKCSRWGCSPRRFSPHHRPRSPALRSGGGGRTFRTPMTPPHRIGCPLLTLPPRFPT